MNCRREVEVKQDGTLMVTVQRWDGNGGGDGDGEGGGGRRVVQCRECGKVLILISHLAK